MSAPLVLVVVAALCFAVTNGLHDTSATVAGPVSTRALTPLMAVVLAAGFNFLGTLVGQAMPHLFRFGVIESTADSVGLLVILSGLLAAIGWNLATWSRALPTSSTHAVFGGLTGAGLLAPDALDWSAAVTRVWLPLVVLPLLAWALAGVVMVAVTWLSYRQSPATTNRRFRMAQSVTAAAIALGHGLQDGQRVVGLIAVALVLAGVSGDDVWVPLSVATALAFGTFLGGWRITRTVARRIVRIEPARGFVADSVSAVLVLGSGFLFGLPASTTHTVVSALVGVGSAHGRARVHWSMVRRVLFAWVLTGPACAAAAALLFAVLRPLVGN